MNRAGRSHFTLADDKNICLFVLEQVKKNSHLFKPPFGNAFWKVAEKNKVTEHSYQAMMGRFKRKLLPDLDRCIFITEEDRDVIKTKLRPYLPKMKDTKDAKDERARVDLTSSDDEEGSRPANMPERQEFSSIISNSGKSDSAEKESNQQRSAAGCGGDTQQLEVEEACMSKSMEAAPAKGEQAGSMDEDSRESARGQPQTADNQVATVATVSKRLYTRPMPGVGEPKAKKGRLMFSKDDDIAILRFLAQELVKHNPNADFMLGNKLWKLAAEQRITAHSWGSMRDRFRRELLPNIKELNYVPSEIRSDILSQIAMYKFPPTGASSSGRVPAKQLTQSPVASPVSSPGTQFGSSEIQKDIEGTSAETKQLTVSTNRDTVHSTVLAMALDGCLTDLEEIRRFTAIADALTSLAVTYEVPMLDVVTTAMTSTNLVQVENVLKNGVSK